MTEVHKLSQLVNRPDWDLFMVWLDDKRTGCYDRMENCRPEDLKAIQGELRLVKELLTLRKTVNNLSK